MPVAAELKFIGIDVFGGREGEHIMSVEYIYGNNSWCIDFINIVKYIVWYYRFVFLKSVLRQAKQSKYSFGAT